MPSDESASSVDRDREILLGILDFAYRFLETLIFEKQKVLRQGTGNILKEGWHDAEVSFARAREQLHSVKWEYIEGVGLSGRQLEMKDRLLRMDVGTGIVGRILQRLDSIMGSLAAVLPILEIAREYKEQVEISVEDLNARV